MHGGMSISLISLLCTSFLSNNELVSKQNLEKWEIILTDMCTHNAMHASQCMIGLWTFVEKHLDLIYAAKLACALWGNLAKKYKHLPCSEVFQVMVKCYHK
jgi:hypothetical protein